MGRPSGKTITKFNFVEAFQTRSELNFFHDFQPVFLLYQMDGIVQYHDARPVCGARFMPFLLSKV